MWWEILPSAAIVTAAMAFPHFSAYVVNYLIIGNCFRRNLKTHDERIQYLRDIRLTGDPYVLQGLEAIPDTPIEDPPNISKTQTFIQKLYTSNIEAPDAKKKSGIVGNELSGLERIIKNEEEESAF